MCQSFVSVVCIFTLTYEDGVMFLDVPYYHHCCIILLVCNTVISAIAKRRTQNSGMKGLLELETVS